MASPIYLNHLDCVYFECFSKDIHVLPKSLECKDQCDLPKSLRLCAFMIFFFVGTCPIYLNRFLCVYFECFSNNIHVLPKSLVYRKLSDLPKSLKLCVNQSNFIFELK